MAFLSAAVVMTLAVAHLSAQSAVADGVIGPRGGEGSYVIQTDSTKAARLTRVARATGVRTLDAQVTGSGAPTPASLFVTTNHRHEMYALIAGRRSLNPSETVVSAEVLRASGVRLGDHITAHADGWQDGVAHLRVVGVAIDAADRRSSFLSIVDPASASTGSIYWILDASPASVGSLEHDVARGVIPTSSNRVAVAHARADPPAVVAALGYACPGAALLLLCCQVACVSIQALARQRDVLALGAAGLSVRWARGLVSSIGIAALTVGSVVGSAAAVVGLRWARLPVSGLLDQYWTDIDVPVKAGIIMAVMPLAGAAGRGQVKRIGGLLTHRARPRRRRSRPASTCFGLIGSAVVMAYLGSQASGGSRSALLTIGTLLAACAVRLIVFQALGRSEDVAGIRLAAHVCRQRGPFFIAVATVAAAAASYAALTTHDANAISSLPADRQQQEGSMLVFQVPAEGAHRLRDVYGSVGGHDVDTYMLPESGLGDVRVTRPDACGRRESSCERGPHVVGFVALSVSRHPDRSAAAPSVLGEGEVEVVTFAEGTSAGTDHGLHRARPDPRLGGNLPSLVVAPTSTMAASLDLRPSGLTEMAFWDFDSLSASSAQRMRDEIATIAPAAQVSEVVESDHWQSQDLRLASAVCLVGLVLVGLTLGTGATAVAMADRRVRRTLATLAPKSGFRARLLGRILLPEIASLIFLASAVPAVADVSSRVPYDGAPGTWWTVSIVAVCVISAATAAVYVYVVPRAVSD